MSSILRSGSRLAAVAAVIGAVACGKGGNDSDGDNGASGSSGSAGDAGGTSGSGTGGSAASAGSAGSATGGAGDATAGGDVGWEDPSVIAESLPTTDEVFTNPERGFMRGGTLTNGGPWGSPFEEGFTLLFSYVRLDDYRDRDLDDAIISDIDAGCRDLREGGLKVVLRFSYNFGQEPDAPLEWVLRHIEQLAPILERNADVIAVVQAGFIGAWGEWHDSTNDLDNPSSRLQIVEALLAALPVTRHIQVRCPVYKHDMFGLDPLTADIALTGTNQARVGHHNDCFLASDTDRGTYPSDRIEEQKTYLSEDNQWVPMGGETCQENPPRSECPTAVAEMERLRFTYINDSYHPDVVASWESGGCREQIDRHIGYRVEVVDVEYPSEVRPGGVIPLRIRLRNVGWAAPINPRPVRVVLEGAERRVAELSSVEVRRLLPGETVTWSARLQTPRALTEGTYALALWLPDASPALEDDSRYSIRLANDGVWDATDGLNRLVNLTVDDAARGSVDESATELVAE